MYSSSGVRNVDSTGWHVPGDGSFGDMTNYRSSNATALPFKRIPPRFLLMITALSVLPMIAGEE